MIGNSVDEVIDSGSSNKRNKTRTGGALCVCYGLVLCDVTRDARINRFGAVAQKHAPKIDGVFFACSVIPAGAAVYDRPMRRLHYQARDDLLGKALASSMRDFLSHGDIREV